MDKVHRLSAKALTDARETYCNNTSSAVSNGSSARTVSLTDILETVAAYAEGMVTHAVQNLTMFCEAADPVAFYQRAWCQFSNPRCVNNYYKSTHLWEKHSTQYRPRIIQSTKNWSWRPQHWQLRAQNETEEAKAASSSPRRKRELDVNDGVVTPRVRGQRAHPTTRKKVKFNVAT